MRVLIITLCLIVSWGCSSKQPVNVDYYHPAYRTSPPEPVYSRVMWSHLPAPIKSRAKPHAPLILPTVSFEMVDATFQEAIEALAQSMGYRWKYPNEIAARKISLNMKGDVEEVLAEIARQAKVGALFDHKNRLVKVVDNRLNPKLPQAQ